MSAVRGGEFGGEEGDGNLGEEDGIAASLMTTSYTSRFGMEDMGNEPKKVFQKGMRNLHELVLVSHTAPYLWS